MATALKNNEPIIATRKPAKVKALVMPTEIYSRIVGYYRPVQNWNEGKKQEFKERKYVKVG